MRRLPIFLLGWFVILFAACTALAEDHGVSREDGEAMQTKIERVEPSVEPSSRSDAKEEDEKRWYEKLEAAVGATGVFQGTEGVEERLNSEGNAAVGTFSFDLELSLPVHPSGKFYALIAGGTGDGTDGDIPTLWSFNGAAKGDDRLRLEEIWYEHTLFHERLRFRAGKIDLTTDFDTNAVANSDKTQFLSSGFVNNLAMELPEKTGIGVMIWVSLREDLGIGIGFTAADRDDNNLFNKTFSIVELDAKPKIGERQGGYRFYGWLNNKDHACLQDPGRTGEKNYGAGLSFDQEVTELLTLFARYGWQRSSVSQIEHAWSAGLQYSGKGYGRKDDVIGVAYGMAVVGSDWEDVDLSNGINSGNEHHLELYYSLKVNDHLSFSPDIQWVKHAGCGSDNGDVWAFGMRARLSF